MRSRWAMVVMLLFCATLRGEQFDVDFTREGAAALRDQAGGIEMHTSVKSPQQQLVTSQAGRVWRFEENQRVSFPTKTAFKPPMTIQIWFRPLAQPLGRMSGLLQQFSYGNGGLRISYLRESNLVRFDWDTGGKESFIETQTPLPLDLWHHLAITLDTDNQLKIHVDGKLDVTQTLDTPFVPSSVAAVTLGTYSGQFGDFVGLMRGVKVSDAVLSDFTQIPAQLQQWNATTGKQEQPAAAAIPAPAAEVDPKTLFDGALLQVGFEGDLSAMANGRRVEPTNIQPIETTDFGKFTPGVRNKAFNLNAFRFISYPVPQGFPSEQGGTISVWVRPADWFSPRGLEAMKKADWMRRKVIFHADGAAGGRPQWSVGLEVIGPLEQQRVRWNAQLGGQVELFHKARLDRQWYLLTITWSPDSIDPHRVRAKFFINGQQMDEALGAKMPMTAVGEHLNIGSTNAGWAYSGEIDELNLLNRPLTSEQILACYRAMKPPITAR
ncbi:MAG: LamG domain-containing protein [Phycisphaerales bacterium]